MAKLFGLRQIDAARKISEDFGLRLFERGIAVPITIATKPKDDFRAWIESAKQIVSAYLNRLYEWDRTYAPKSPSDELHPLFVESLHKIDYIEYLEGILLRGTESEKRDMYENGRGDIEAIRKRLDSLAVEQQTKMRRAI